MIDQITSRAARAIAAGAITAALATVGVPALAAMENLGPAPANEHPANPQTTQLAESSGQLLLARIKAASDMIASGQYDAARNELDSAQDTAGAIEAMTPYSGVVDQIRMAKRGMVARGPDGFHDDLIPAYAQLDELSVSKPKVAMTAKQKLYAAEREAKMGNYAQARTDVDGAIETITAAAVFPLVDYVYDQVATARIALEGDHPDVAKANQAVQNAEKRLAAVVTTGGNIAKRAPQKGPAVESMKGNG